MTTTVKLDKFVGCKLFEPFQGRNPCVTLLPGEEKLIGYKIIDRAAQISFGLVSAFKEGAQDMIQATKTYGMRYQRLFNNLDVGITAYILNHQNGISYLYENLSTQYVLKEQLMFELDNARIEAIPGRHVDILLRPGQSYLINISPIVAGQPYSIRVAGCRFAVESEIMYPSF